MVHIPIWNGVLPGATLLRRHRTVHSLLLSVVVRYAIPQRRGALARLEQRRVHIRSAMLLGEIALVQRVIEFQLA